MTTPKTPCPESRKPLTKQTKHRTRIGTRGLFTYWSTRTKRFGVVSQGRSVRSGLRVVISHDGSPGSPVPPTRNVGPPVDRPGALGDVSLGSQGPFFDVQGPKGPELSSSNNYRPRTLVRLWSSDPCPVSSRLSLRVKGRRPVNPDDRMSTDLYTQ